MTVGLASPSFVASLRDGLVVQVASNSKLKSSLLLVVPSLSILAKRVFVVVLCVFCTRESKVGAN